MSQSAAQQRELLAGEVVAWRRERLVAAGFTAGPARALARDRRIDLHALIGLAERGCPPDTAARTWGLSSPGPADTDDHRRW